MSRLRGWLSRLQAQILEIGGLKLKSVETRLSLVVNQIDKLMGQVTKANVAIKTAQRSVTGPAGTYLQLVRILCYPGFLPGLKVLHD